MLTDDAGDPSLRTTEMLATAALERGWEGRVAACHARAMGVYPQPTLRRLLGLATRAGMSFVSNPHTGPLHLPIAEVIAEGIPVALGQDDIEDAYYPYGQHNLLEIAFLASHLLHRYTTADMDMFFDMITVHGRRAMGLPTQQIEVGAPADLVVLDGDTVHQALTRHAPPRIVLRAGRIVATTTSATAFPCFS
jgi:cytosine deaminase